VETGSDGNVYATQYPKYCYTGQTSTDVTSPGGSIVLIGFWKCYDSVVLIVLHLLSTKTNKARINNF
jgi:hypothetical protein